MHIILSDRGKSNRNLPCPGAEWSGESLSFPCLPVRSGFFDVDRAGGERELDPLVPEPLEDAQVQFRKHGFWSPISRMWQSRVKFSEDSPNPGSSLSVSGGLLNEAPRK